MGTQSLLRCHLAGDNRLALMLSGGTCWSLWERFSVWMTQTVRASRVPIIQLNPDRADKARRAWAGNARMQTCGQMHASAYTRANKNTGKHTDTQQGAAYPGPTSLWCCSSCWGLGSHSCELGERRGWKKMKKWENVEMTGKNVLQERSRWRDALVKNLKKREGEERRQAFNPPDCTCWLH